MNHAILLKRFLQVTFFDCAIALGLSAVGEHSLRDNLVYSQCIGLSA